MTIQIPLGPRPAAASSTAVSVNLSASVGGALTKLQSEDLRAAAAAVAMADPGGGLATAKQARDDLSKIVKPGFTASEVQKVLNAVQAERETPSGATPPAAVTAVAAAAGANPRFAAAALAVVQTDTAALSNALLWVASLDAGVLDRASLAATRITALSIIPDQLTRLQQVENSVGTLNTKVDKIDTRVKYLEGKGKQ
jgi:hypothetical protein